MRKLIILLICMVSVTWVKADNKNQGDPRTPVVKIVGTWTKLDSELTPPANVNIITLAEGITYYSSDEGIFLNLQKPAGNVKLFSLTGEVIWQGNLVQGRFQILTRQGIYFLRINNKSYKVICK